MRSNKFRWQPRRATRPCPRLFVEFGENQVNFLAKTYLVRWQPERPQTHHLQRRREKTKAEEEDIFLVA